MVFTVALLVGPQIFLDALATFATLVLLRRPPCGEVGTSIFIFPHKVATRISQQPCVAMIFTLLNRVFHRCPVYFRNRVYVPDTPCGGVGTSIFTPPV